MALCVHELSGVYPRLNTLLQFLSTGKFFFFFLVPVFLNNQNVKNTPYLKHVLYFTSKLREPYGFFVLIFLCEIAFSKRTVFATFSTVSPPPEERDNAFV